MFLYLVSERQSAIDVQTVVTLQLQQRIAQKFLWREREKKRERMEQGKEAD